MAVLLVLLAMLASLTVTAGLSAPARAATTPGVQSISPKIGSAAGRSVVVVSGTGVGGATAVLFGTKQAEFRVVSPDRIEAESPAGTGAVPIKVKLGTTLHTGPTFTYTTKPIVHHVYPANGSTAGGTEVSIYGENLLGVSSVRFGGTGGSKVDVSSDGRSLSVTTPKRAAGKVDVVATSPAGASITNHAAANDFTFLDPAVGAPVIEHVSPNAGLPGGGQMVTVYGTNLHGATAVTFGGTRGTEISVAPDGTQLTVKNPRRAPGKVNVVVSTPRGPSTPVRATADDFTYTLAPTVSYVSPNAGPIAGGTQVWIYGANLASATSVRFGTVSTSAISYRAPGGYMLQVTAPKAASARTVDVVVVTPAGNSTASYPQANDYLYTNRAIISYMNQSVVPLRSGTALTINGVNFTGATSVTVGGTAATNLVVNPAGTQATVKLPAKAAGTYDVLVMKGTTRSLTQWVQANNLTYTGKPVITYVSPDVGRPSGGTQVHVSGLNLGGATPPKVTFGGTSGTSVVAAKDGRSLTVVTPAKTAGRYDVVVTNAGGRSAPRWTESNDFTYSIRPSIYHVSPRYGGTAGGSVVTLSGENLGGATKVTFGGVPGTKISVAPGGGQLTVTAPAKPAGVIDLVDVVVTTPRGTSVGSYYTQDDFVYTDKPIVEFLYPNTGPPTGGTLVTLVGHNFKGATAVRFGSTSAPVVATDIAPDGTSVRVTSPKGALGTVDLLVVTPKGLSSPGEWHGGDDFSYANAPAMLDAAPAPEPGKAGPPPDPEHPLSPAPDTTAPVIVNHGTYITVDGVPQE